jgi:hypothetical protein
MWNNEGEETINGVGAPWLSVQVTGIFAAREEESGAA